MTYIFSEATSCNLRDRHRRFKGTRKDNYMMKMGSEVSPETPIPATRKHRITPYKVAMLVFISLSREPQVTLIHWLL
jgi:hypothetical protein